MNLQYKLFIKKIICIGLLMICMCQMNDLHAQTSKSKVDSIQDLRVGFSSLFTITTTGNKEKPFNFQLNPKAISFIQSYMDKQGPELIKMKTWAKPYFNLYDEILTANGVPVELKYLSVIESHLSSNLVSWAGAVGPWQLMPDEAARFGLKTSPIDERTDYRKSTIAAATLLKELYAQFGDWLLVVAAYNGGAGRVKQAIQKKGTKDFWQLQYELPLETRNHVKKFIATHYVMEENARAFDERGKLSAFDERGKLSAFDPTLGMDVKNKKNSTSVLLQTDLKEIVVSGRYKISVIAAYLDIVEKELSALNPKFDQVVASGKNYFLKLPKDKLEKFEAHKNDILQASLQSLYTIKE
jgi:membrane-bound lytic murein transglycosylase D